ncbi:MAG: glycosyltransferase family 39 protein [Candidatus Hydrogenedentes bacterium]|nr:glycosyltransferase family 39 protein [Candidatus Hydrogenedentota bacterium]
MTASESTSRDGYARAGIALVLVAIALRLVEYLHNKAIWLDEAHLALNILKRDYAGLTQRLDFGQGAPLFFLWGERLAANLLGPSEYALRLLPLLASIAACILVYFFFRRMLSAQGFLIALAVFAISVPSIRYAAEVKAYATDIAVAIALYLLLVPGADEKRVPNDLTARRAIVLTIVGALSVWCAFPALFVLTGIGAVFVLRGTVKRNTRQAVTWASVLAVWLFSIVSNYSLMLRYNAENAEVRTWWLDRFMPLPPTSISDFYWFVRTFFEVFSEPIGLVAAGLGALFFLVGAYAIWNQDRWRLAVIVAPIGAALLASGMQVYPFMGRFLLFAAPLVLVIIGEGWNFFAAHVHHRAILAVAAIVLFIQPAAAALKGALHAPPQGVRPAFEYVNANWQDNDKLYVYCWAVPSFNYYEIKSNRSFPKIAGQSLRADWRGYIDELKPLRGSPRVWLVLTNTPKRLAGQEDKFFVTHMDMIGTRVNENVFEESSVYLYDLTAAPQ